MYKIINSVDDLPDYGDNIIAFDIETEGLYTDVRLAQFYNPEIDKDVYIVDLAPSGYDINKYKDEVNKLKTYICEHHTVLQNSSYDLGTLNIAPEKFDDTYFALKIGYPEFGTEGFGLKNVVKRLRSTAGLYDSTDEDHGAKGFPKGSYISKSAYRYAAIDVIAVHKIWNEPKIRHAVQQLVYKVDIISQRYALIYQQNGLQVDREFLLVELEKSKKDVVKYTALLPQGFKPNSYLQVRKHLGIEKSDRDALVEYSLSANDDAIDADSIIRLKRAKKEVTYLKSVNFDKMITKFNVAQAVSGRFSASGGDLCLTGDTMITMFNGSRKRLDKINVGDMVYTFTKEGKLAIRPVLRVMSNGKKEVINLKWRSLSNKVKGELKCTPDHMVRLFNGKWVEAQNTLGSRVSYCRRAEYTDVWSAEDHRPMLYSNGLDRKKQEQQFIKEDILGYHRSLHSHHINEDTEDNSINNIDCISSSKHTSHHSQGRTHSANTKQKLIDANFTDVSVYSVLKHLRKYGNLHTYKYSHPTVKKRLKDKGIDTTELYIRYKRRVDIDGNWIPANKIKYAHKKFNTYELMQNYLNVATYRILKSLLLDMELDNHKIYAIDYHGLEEVYDIEVEDTHNYIANEICVHNCNGFNSQQIPRNFQYLFNQPDEDTVIIDADYSTLELRLAATIFGDRAMYSQLMNGEDLHTSMAIQVTGKILAAEGLLKVTGSLRDMAEVSKEYVTDRDRQNAKAVNFGFVFSMSAKSFVVYARTSFGVIVTLEEAEHLRTKYFELYKQIGTHHRYVWKNYKKPGFLVYTALGRPIKPKLGTDGINGPVQGSGADTMKLAVHYLVKDNPDKPILDWIYNVVHDACYLRVPRTEDRKDIGERLEVAMLKAWVEMGKTKLFKWDNIPMIAEVEYHTERKAD